MNGAHGRNSAVSGERRTANKIMNQDLDWIKVPGHHKRAKSTMVHVLAHQSPGLTHRRLGKQ
jgi:hypothetical protein